MLWSFHPKFALNVKTDDPIWSLRRSAKVYCSHIESCFWGTQGKLPSWSKNGWRKRKDTGLAFTVIREWGWDEDSHLWAGLTWSELPASTKGIPGILSAVAKVEWEWKVGMHVFDRQTSKLESDYYRSSLSLLIKNVIFHLIKIYLSWVCLSKRTLWGL